MSKRSGIGFALKTSEAGADESHFTASGEIALRVTGLAKRFGGVEVLIDVNFEVKGGEIFGLIGPNGAGKTTLLNLVTGIDVADAGVVEIEGVLLNRLKSWSIAKLGVARTFQTVRLIPGATVLEQIGYGGYSRMVGGRGSVKVFSGRTRREGTRLKEDVLELVDLVGLRGKGDSLAETLSYGDQRRVEIARALIVKPRLLLLDEPAAGMGEKDWKPLARLLVQLKERGIAVVLVEHNIPMIKTVCDRIVVMDSGRVIAEGNPEDCFREEAVLKAYFNVNERISDGVS